MNFCFLGDSFAVPLTEKEKDYCVGMPALPICDIKTNQMLKFYCKQQDKKVFWSCGNHYFGYPQIEKIKQALKKPLHERFLTFYSHQRINQTVLQLLKDKQIPLEDLEILENLAIELIKYQLNLYPNLFLVPLLAWLQLQRKKHSFYETIKNQIPSDRIVNIESMTDDPKIYNFTERGHLTALGRKMLMEKLNNIAIK
ncbi:MAG: hypothetical protein F6J93_34345 [Oscillatoria sp. SIO1A7]|nr:hypothetical protein [Oscillatoria sp. SIO1A7]